ncbi:PQQ-dependent sugar dehydrogenase [Arcicella lustrica]|uniref:PQQ-dependent sugar dehydrogenase n=1 Tax=Arcicella lustrica TaxID=2984196 RepID=A0ABU5SL39_9BACT|nr:PQQ-dependent sugar dehydrogenase [Arcicella sp. DC25W]MEA5427907.1 PQQ-dependent sugar dehydrogenase [Arcicella sp. DC25W]
MNRNNNIIYFIGCLMIFSHCSQNGSSDTPSTPSTPTSPVETNPPNTNYSPAFSGQTRINRVRTVSDYQVSNLTTNLSNPWGITALPDGRLLITEKAGRMRIVSPTTGEVSNPISGIPTVNSAGQGGLLGLCLDPVFTSNRMVYWVFSESVSGGTVTSVAKARLANNETSMEGISVIYRSNTPYNGNLHYGGRVVFDRTGNLIVSIGERSSSEIRTMAQSANSSLGKVVRITTNGQPASGNPTFSQSNALLELFTMGHRNPQGLAVHPVTGDVWQSEHGPRGGDEINRLQAGSNYGWPVVTYGIEYGGQAIGSAIQQQSGMEQPVYYWDPVVSPSGMTFYSGNRIPEWQNNLFIGSLSGTHIVRLVIENNKVTGEERLLSNEGQRFRDITQGIDGALYAITDQGRLYKIDRR